MTGFILRRILYMIPVLLGVTLIVFVLFHAVGGNPVYHRLPKNATSEQIAMMEEQMGLDKPIIFQYFEYLGDLFHLDLGRSWETHQRVSEMFLNGIGPSLSLAIPAFFIGSILAIFIAMLAAYFHQRAIDRFLVIISVLGMSISILAFIIAGQVGLSYWARWFPISGWEPGLEGIPYLALPILIWVIASLGEDVRYYRTVLLEEMGRDYVLTARAKGVGTASILFRHILKNAMIPITTRLILALPGLFVGSLLLEAFFGIPGLGNLSINALNAADFPVLKAVTLLGAVVYLFANLLGDVLYSVFDPRVRLQ